MKPLKAFGKDGFLAFFFQSQWNIIGQDLVQFLQDTFEGVEVEPDLCKLTITLIPKSS